MADNPVVDLSVHLMAMQSMHDDKIRLNDILAHAENVRTLQYCTTGQEAPIDAVRQELLINYPHLHDRQGTS